jgi:hypothetical protein
MLSQRAWSLKNFGDTSRNTGLLAHIRKEVAEIEQDPSDLVEWTDLIILGMEGFWKNGGQPSQLIEYIEGKQAVNRARTWPKPTSPDQPIEHIQ